MDLTVARFLIISNTIGLGQYSVIRVMNMDIAPLYGPAAFPGNWRLKSVKLQQKQWCSSGQKDKTKTTGHRKC